MNREPLQSFTGHQYERPQQAWICGARQQGQPCPLGPTAHGGCQGTQFCQPIRRGDRWECNRSPLQGGSCEQGPSPTGQCGQSRPPCVPFRSWSSARRMVTGTLTALTAGLVLLLVAVPQKRELLAPGPLSQGHAQILAGARHANRCVACHPRDPDPIAWLAADHRSTTLPSGQSTLCLECHRQDQGAWARYPHGLPPETLAELREQIEPPQHRRFALPTATSADGQLACATCHREHHGSQHNLAALTNRQCQTCHQRRFDSFAQGHPEFDTWPYPRRTRIAFDHATHQLKYFPTAERTFDCRGCHTNESGAIVSLAGFQTCAACHAEKIRLSGQEGLTLLALPMLDMQAIERHQAVTIESWPETARGMFDGAVPTWARLLLYADPPVQNLLAELGPQLDLTQVNPNHSAQVHAAAELASAIRRLMQELATDGPTALQTRLERVLDSPIEPSLAERLWGQLPQTLLADTQAQWFAAPASTSLGAESTELTEEKRPSDQSPESPPSDPSPDHAASDELLVDDAKEEHLLQDGDGQSLLDMSDEDAFLSDDDSLLSGQAASDPFAGLRQSVSEATVPKETQTDPAPSAAGWHRDDTLLRLHYVPSGHADPLLTAWIELLVAQQQHPAVDPMLSSLQGAAGIGQCLTCHSVEHVDGRLQVQWHARQNTPRGFTRFSHAQHLLQPQLQDCTACHQIDPSAPVMTSYEQHDPFQFGCGFKTLSKATCASCHHAKAAGDRCTTCHRYHVDGSPSRPIVADGYRSLVR